LPENNKGMNIVPQILTNDSEGFITLSGKLQQLGYNEVNLNLGCPAGTVVSDNKKYAKKIKKSQKLSDYN